MTFGEHMIQLRKEQDMKQCELAKKAGISNSVIGYYEADKAVPTVYRAYDIACALGVTLDDMMR